MRTWVALARQTIDRATARMEPRPSCRGVGCVGCCFGPVPVHPHELEDVLPLVTDAQLEAAVRASRIPWKQAWCPLLDLATGRCTIYERRPLVCRGFAVTSPPEDCDPTSPATPVRHPGAMGALDEAMPAGLHRDAIVLVDALADEHRRRAGGSP
jgi:Fe-S-cluster containining protein